MSVGSGRGDNDGEPWPGGAFSCAAPSLFLLLLMSERRDATSWGKQMLATNGEGAAWAEKGG